MVRAFIAIDVSEDVRSRLVAVQSYLAKTGNQLKLVEPENLHLTIKFLGEIQEEKVPEIVEEMKKAVSGISPFEIHIAGVGVFPDQHYVRVVWAGVSAGGERVVEIQRKIDTGLNSIGFSPERDFHPHITLARVKFIRERAKFMEFLKEAQKADFGVTRVEAILVKQSTLTPKGPIYSDLAKVPLG